MSQGEQVFEFLFNVSLHELLSAQLQFAWPVSVLLLVLVLGVLAALLCSGYIGARGAGWLMMLRAGVAVIAVLIVARPQLLLPRPDSTAGSVAVLIDDSASMSIKDAAGGVSRAQSAQTVLAARRGALESRFDVRYMRFDARMRDAAMDETAAAGAALEQHATKVMANDAGPALVNRSNAVSDPLGVMVDAVAGGDVAALVLISDGGQISGVDERELLGRLRASGVAVHVLGVGDAQLAPDVGIRAVSVPPRVLNDDEVDVRVELSAAGFAGQNVNLRVSDNGALAGERSVRVDAARFRRSVTIPIRVREPGMRRIEVRVQAPSGDRVAANDIYSTLLNVRSQAVRVLHFEARPRFEVKFLRRALADDATLSLSSLVRTGDNRYLRLGISAPEELADGFPLTAEELFRYQVLVIGSVNVATFSEQQLQLLERFVNVRGGSVLFLGGREAFAQGGWGARRVARMLPVALESMQSDLVANPFNVAARARLTAAGREHAVTRGLFDGTAAQQALALPALAVVNPLRHVKPGASVLLQGDDGGALPLVMLAWQRFGAGRVAVLPVRDSWRWRMHADVPVDDRTHEMFWRRLLRWLARDVPSRVSVRAVPALAAPGQMVRFEARVHDEQWQLVSDAQARVRISTPLGDIVERALSGEDDGPVDGPGSARNTNLNSSGSSARAGGQADGNGTYGARYIARDSGVYEVHVVDEQDRQDAGSLLASDDAAGLMVRASGEEFVAPSLHDERLRRIAGATGGSYRHLSQAGDLLARIAASVPAVPSWQRVALWNAPVLLLGLLLLACSEWWLRRQRRHLP